MRPPIPKSTSSVRWDALLCLFEHFQVFFSTAVKSIVIDLAGGMQFHSAILGPRHCRVGNPMHKAGDTCQATRFRLIQQTEPEEQSVTAHEDLVCTQPRNRGRKHPIFRVTMTSARSDEAMARGRLTHDFYTMPFRYDTSHRNLLSNALADPNLFHGRSTRFTGSG